MKASSLIVRLAALTATALLSTGCLSIMPSFAPTAENVEPNISAEFRYTYKTVDVRGSKMAYVEAGTASGAPIVLVHGNPTSAYLWRNVIPHLSGGDRVIAVDLIGMGRSDKPDIAYRFEDHAAYFSDFMKAMGLKHVVLVLHDWGGAIGIDYAARQKGNVRGIVVMEAVMKPMSLSDADFATRYLFGRLRDPKDNHQIVAVDNYFVEKLLPMMSGRELSKKETAAYGAPYPTIASRKPVAMWPREIPLDGEPADNTRRIGANFEWLKSSDVPLLMMYADPGMIWTDTTRPPLEAELPRMKSVSIGSGLHYLQEVQPTKIGRTVAEWVAALPANGAAGR